MYVYVIKFYYIHIEFEFYYIPPILRNDMSHSYLSYGNTYARINIFGIIITRNNSL